MVTPKVRKPWGGGAGGGLRSRESTGETADAPWKMVDHMGAGAGRTQESAMS